jgi:putative phosphoribosyl transferase
MDFALRFIGGFMALSSRFQDREEAGQELARALKETIHVHDPILFALPRGGVPVAFEISKALEIPMDVLIVRKLGHPLNPEYAIGATTEGGFTLLNSPALARERPGFNEEDLEILIAQEQREIERRIESYRGKRARADVKGRDVIVVDDGLATGLSALAAARYLREEGARRVLLAVPVCSAESCRKMRPDFDRIVCLIEAENFFAVGPWYRHFDQLSDEDVLNILSQFNLSPRGLELPAAQSLS